MLLLLLLFEYTAFSNNHPCLCQNHFFANMKIVNINYKGFVSNAELYIDRSELAKKQPPQALTFKCKNGATLLVFSSGKCRVMGCKTPITSIAHGMFPLPVKITHIQSVTATVDLGYSVNLIKLAQHLGSQSCMFEPEIFPALRITKKFNPVCVNVFASGKVTILGLKTINISSICQKIKSYLDDLNKRTI